MTPVQGRGVVDAVISQNIDGLHLRSGLPPGCLYELHGNSFMERCRRCHKTHFRPFDVNGMSFKPTGRCCEGLRSAAARQKRARDDDGSGAFEACGGELHDFMLDWGDALPAAQLKASERLCQRALCLLCLGTSLYINPCGLLPTRTKKSGGKVVIVSLSATAQDAIADVVSRAEADEFLAQLCTVLDVPVPRFVPALTFYVAQACARVPNFGVNTVNWRVAVSACSDAQPSPLPHLVRATARVRSAVAAAGGGSACSTPPPASPPAAVCKLERYELMPAREILRLSTATLICCGRSVCDDGSARTRWLFEGQAEASGSALHVSLELVWHSAVSCAPSFAAERHDSSVMELELVPDSGAGCATAPAAATCVAAPRQRHGWHQIGRYVSFRLSRSLVFVCLATTCF